VLTSGDDIVGRVNLNNIVQGVLRSGNLGYWVDHAHLRRGLAREAVRFAVEAAPQLGLHRVEAGTLVHNTASQRVLLACGFEYYGMAPRLLFINGAWQDHNLYQRILHDEPL
jgi:ribosomal-protein-alanine N-acetyltransferase